MGRLFNEFKSLTAEQKKSEEGQNKLKVYKGLELSKYLRDLFYVYSGALDKQGHLRNYLRMTSVRRFIF